METKEKNMNKKDAAKVPVKRKVVHKPQKNPKAPSTNIPATVQKHVESVTERERQQEEAKRRVSEQSSKKEEQRKRNVKPATSDKKEKASANVRKQDSTQNVKSEEQTKSNKKEPSKSKATHKREVNPAYEVEVKSQASKAALEELLELQERLRQKEAYLERKEEEICKKEEELCIREEELKKKEDELKRREKQVSDSLTNVETNSEEVVQNQRDAESIDDSEVSDDLSIEEDKREEDKTALGIGYFLGEEAVPPEVSELVESFAGYADELVEEKKASALMSRKAMLTKIEEESPEQDTPSKEATSEEEKKPLKGERQIGTSNLNPLSSPTKTKRQANLGASCDSATLANAFGLIDLKSLCRSFAHAIHKHIVFSQGKKTFNELQAKKDFTYNLGNMLKIDTKNQISIEKIKDILSESLSAMTGTKIKADLLSSYLTIEDNEDDVDWEYTKSNMGSILGHKGFTPGKFVETYKKSLATLKASDEKRQTLLRTQKNMHIQGMSDVDKFLTTCNRNKTSTHCHRRASSDELAREEEEIDLNSIDISQKYTEPKEQKPILKEAPSMGANVDEATSKEYVEAFSIFQLNYDFDTDQFIDLSSIPGEYLKTPTEREIYKFCKKVQFFSKMEKEIPIIALIYIERLMLSTGLLMNALNWRRFAFLSLVLGSKVWDDESFENVHFTKAFPDVTLKEINELERVYLHLLEYKMYINGSEYAKYYFILRTVAEKANMKFPLKPMNVDEVMKLQTKAQKMEDTIKEARMRKTQ